MAAIVSLLVVIAVSLVITRVATVMLTLTGLSRESARFQARSAFTGAGFTTTESEAVVGHPVRRRIILVLMLLGNAGVVTGVATLLLGFVGVGGATRAVVRAGTLAGGLFLIVWVSRSRVVDRFLSRAIERALRRWTRVDARDYAGLLHLGGDWRVVELQVEPQDWLANRPLEELRLPEEGVVVLGVQRADGRYVGAPRGSARIVPGDVVLLYGREQVLDDLDARRGGQAGDAAHRAARAAHAAVAARENAETSVHG